MHKFFVPYENIHGDTAHITGEDVKHIQKVLRLKVGEEVNINNCCGEEFDGIVESIGKDEVIVNLIKKLCVHNESPLDVFLYQALPKAQKMDLIIQKAVELGVKAVIPIITSRVVVKNGEHELKKIDRWKRICLEACKQCKRNIIPDVRNPLKFDETLQDLKSMDLVVVPYENQKGYGIKSLMGNIDRKKVKRAAVIIGPEGGFEEDEIESLKSINAAIVTLGPRILRTETAGFVAVSLLMYELGDIGGVYL